MLWLLEIIEVCCLTSFLSKSKKHFLFKAANNKKVLFHSKLDKGLYVNSAIQQRLCTNTCKKHLKVCSLGLTFKALLTSTNSLVLSEAYSSSNCQHERFLIYVLTAKILHLHKYKELSIVPAQKQRNQMQY